MPTRVVIAPLVLTTLLFTAGASYAQSNAFSEATVQQYVKIGLENIQRAKCEGGRRCSSATPDEFANPPVTASEARKVLVRGYISGMGERCGLDWQKQNFFPMMAYWRKSNKTERQLALIGILHGITQSQTMSETVGMSCSGEGRREFQTQLKFKP